MLTKKTLYALQALQVLGELPDKRPQLIAEIAQKARVPQKFLEQILRELKQVGFVDSKKGLGGGYFLKLDPRRITLGQVIRTMSGAVALVSCVSKTAYAPCPECKDEATCGLKAIMEDVHGAMTRILDSKTLGDILAEAQKRQKGQKGQMYHI